MYRSTRAPVRQSIKRRLALVPLRVRVPDLRLPPSCSLVPRVRSPRPGMVGRGRLELPTPAFSYCVSFGARQEARCGQRRNLMPLHGLRSFQELAHLRQLTVFDHLRTFYGCTERYLSLLSGRGHDRPIDDYYVARRSAVHSERDTLAPSPSSGVTCCRRTSVASGGSAVSHGVANGR